MTKPIYLENGKVVTFEPRKPSQATLEGEARCLTCHHRWEATAPIGTFWLECPACQSMKGSFRWPVMPKDGETRWVCNCGSDVFFIKEQYVPVCSHCGAQQFSLAEYLLPAEPPKAENQNENPANENKT